MERLHLQDFTNILRAAAPHPREGEPGYSAWGLAEIEAGRCPCEGCGGELTDAALSPTGWRHCRRCRCAQKVQTVYGQRYPAWVPAYGRCRRADEQMKRWLEELEAQRRQRRGQSAAAEEYPIPSHTGSDRAKGRRELPATAAPGRRGTRPGRSRRRSPASSPAAGCQ